MTVMMLMMMMMMVVRDIHLTHRISAGSTGDVISLIALKEEIEWGRWYTLLLLFTDQFPMLYGCMLHAWFVGGSWVFGVDTVLSTLVLHLRLKICFIFQIWKSTVQSYTCSDFHLPADARTGWRAHMCPSRRRTVN